MRSAAVPTLVPARSGRAVRVARGEYIRVTDVEGGQVGDLFAFVAGDPSGGYLSASHTRTATGRMFPAVNETFVTDRRRPMLTLVDDTSPGHHDLLIAACDPQRYAELGVPDHPSCTTNLITALATMGLAAPVVPQPVNVFMRVQADADGRLDWLPAATSAGDSITFRAELDCVVVLSACPQDLTVINGKNPTALALDVLEEIR
ncbi:hypothetical protein EV138_6436 [Kribbella voronezhensis]|uniref:DUF1989 domain-containing protein n=1 Tax=Kribbella voronezhensis TaxID=2512212 RepID=A0A4R7SX84_9ACTN|nr:urea carboxylase-associated family protein [Kribbella voronezhensis]TDU83972.1 hypothetical protein EV138_6436 [Kribbella voronezhensis]